MSDLKLVQPPAKAPEPAPFYCRVETVTEFPSGRSLTVRTPIHGSPPPDFRRYAVGVQVVIAQTPAGPLHATRLAQWDADSIPDAFAKFDAEKDAAGRVAHAEGIAELQRQRIAANVNAGLNGHGRIKGLRG